LLRTGAAWVKKERSAPHHTAGCAKHCGVLQSDPSPERMFQCVAVCMHHCSDHCSRQGCSSATTFSFIFLHNFFWFAVFVLLHLQSMLKLHESFRIGEA